jgi:hypothetical protein
VDIVCPTEATAKINAILSGRRGQILGFDTREGWPGWDRVRSTMPEAEIGELIVELPSRRELYVVIARKRGGVGRAMTPTGPALAGPLGPFRMTVESLSLALMILRW